MDGGLIVVRAADAAGNETEAVAPGKLFVNVDPAWALVNDAKAAFKANVANTTEVDKAVLALPEADDISYAVTGSSNDELISDAGLLLKQPGTSTDVELTVTIAAKAKPAIKTEVKVKVTLPAIYTGGGGGSGGIILPAAPAASTNYALSAVVSRRA